MLASNHQVWWYHISSAVCSHCLYSYKLRFSIILMESVWWSGISKCFTWVSLEVRNAGSSHQACYNSLPLSLARNSPQRGRKTVKETLWYLLLWLILSTRVCYIGLNAHCQDNTSLLCNCSCEGNHRNSKHCLIGIAMGECVVKQQRRSGFCLPSLTLQNILKDIWEAGLPPEVLFWLDLAEHV